MDLPNSTKAILLIVFVLTTASLSILNIYNFLSKQPEVIITDTLDEKISYWQGFVNENPTYRDGYLVLSKLYFKKNNLPIAQNLARRAYYLDPLSSEVINTGRVLGIKSF